MIKRSAVFIGFLALAVIWFWKEIFFNYLFCFSDLTFYFYPYRSLMTEIIRHGSLPLWNPYLQMGFPLLAALQPCVFYPFSLLYYLLPFDQAFNWFLIVHFPLGAFFMYLLGRELKLSPPAALAAGITFGFSGYLVSVLHMPTTLSSIVWLPLVVIFFRRALDPATRYALRVTNIILCALFLALMFLGGEPTVFFGTFWVLLAVLISEHFHDRLKIRQGVFIIFASFGLALLIDAVQLLPFLELAGHSSRAGGISFAEAGYFSLKPRELLELIFPYFFTLSKFPWVSLSWMKFPYLGAVPVGLAVAGLFLSRDRRVYWLGFGCLLVLFIILGANSPVPVYFVLYKLVPGFNLFRYPVKFIFILVFALSYLTGLGIDRLGEAAAGLKQVRIAALVLFVPLLLLFTAFFFLPVFTFRVFGPLFAEAFRQGLGRYVVSVTVPRDIANLGVFVFFLALFIIWVSLRESRRIGRELFVYGLAALVLLDLYSANGGIGLAIRGDDYKNAVPENIRLLQADKSDFRFLVAPDVFQKSHWEISSEFSDYTTALYYLRERLTADQPMLYHLADANGYESITGAEQDALFKKIWGLDSLSGVRVLDLMNVKYLITSGLFPQPGYRLVRRERDIYKGGGIYLYRNERVLPRGFVVPRAVEVDSRSATLDKIFRTDFDPEREVVLSEPVKSPGGFWFTSEWYYPGWKAFVDGREAKIYRADYMFRAVPVPPGFHEVKFVYDPPVFKWGLAISLLSLFGVIVAFSIIIVYNKNR